MSEPSRGQPWLSVIIPTLNEADTLPRCLGRLRGALPAGEFEIIVADGGSTDGTLAVVAAEPHALAFSSVRGRAQQLNAGAARARGVYLWFLHADTLPPENWAEHLRAAAGRGLPASFSIEFTGQDKSRALRFYGRGSRWNSWLVRFGDQSLFVSRRAFERSGGYRADHRVMEGHELARRLRRQEGGFRLLPASLVTSSRRYQQHGVVFTQAVYVVIVVLYYLGVGQQRLAWIYRRAF